MKKYLKMIFALVIVGILSYHYKLMSFILLAVIALGLVVQLVLGIN